MMRIDDALLDRFIEDQISSEEAIAITDWLATPANLDRFVARAELHTDLHRSLRRRQIQEQAMRDFRCGDGVDSDEVDLPAAPTVLGTPMRRRSRFGMGVALIALVTAASLLAALLLPDRNRSATASSGVIATLAYQSHAQWHGSSVPEGSDVGPGVLDLQVGLARLDFANGATVTLQGPARYELIGPNRTRLESGLLTASVPDSANGFQVLTPAMDVIDRGTAFGVSVGIDGQTDVNVFEGEVEVALSSEDAARDPQRVREGNAVRSRPIEGTIRSVPYNPTPYEDAWPLTSGVLHANGLMKFVSPGPDFVPGRYEDNQRILVFPEQKGVRLLERVPVDLTKAGQYRRIHRQSQDSLRAGRIVDSFLLQLNPVGQMKKKTLNKPRAIGQISFDRPILGLIGGTAKLSATDGLLGHPRGDYRKEARGIEPARPGTPPDQTRSDQTHSDQTRSDQGRDIVILSADRRTLSVDLSAGSAVDQIRVLVRSKDRARPNSTESLAPSFEI